MPAVLDAPEVRVKVLECPVCGLVRVGVPRRQRFCSKVCANNTPGALERNRANGRKGGLASGVTRPRMPRAQSEHYQAGYSAGWIAGRRNGFAEALGERDQPGRPTREQQKRREQVA